MSGNVSYRILVDNESHYPGLEAEHGFSVWIEFAGKKILFDCGCGEIFLNNASILGINPESADFLVLSHGHYDHTGGLEYMPHLGNDAKIYANRGILSERFSLHDDGSVHDIGLPTASDKYLSSNAEKVSWVDSPICIAENIWLTGPVPRVTEYENTGGNFCFDRDGQQEDPVEDDLALWIDAEEGVWVFLGCAHSGVINTLDYIDSITNGKHFYAIIGGMHLRDASSDRLSQTAAAISEYNPEILIPCHCTGKVAGETLLKLTGKYEATSGSMR